MHTSPQGVILMFWHIQTLYVSFTHTVEIEPTHSHSCSKIDTQAVAVSPGPPTFNTHTHSLNSPEQTHTNIDTLTRHSDSVETGGVCPIFITISDTD